MDSKTKKQMRFIAFEVAVIVPLCIIGLLFSTWFILGAVFCWLAFEVYAKFVEPGGPW